MKLILTGDVPNLGAPGDIVEVKDGYGRNYLLPRGLAVVATRGAEKQVDAIRRARKSREIRDLGHAREVAAQLGGLTVTVKANAKTGLARPEAAHAESLRPSGSDRWIACATEDSRLCKQVSIGCLVTANECSYRQLTTKLPRALRSFRRTVANSHIAASIQIPGCECSRMWLTRKSENTLILAGSLTRF